MGLEPKEGIESNPLQCVLLRRHCDVATFLIEAGANFNAMPRSMIDPSGESGRSLSRAS
jgi:hypothetical protein